MTLMVCSGFHPAGYEQYGAKFLRSFEKFAHPEIKLGVWVEEPLHMPRNACRDLWAIPGAREFHEKHADNLDAQGRVEHPIWKASERVKGYSFRTDAYKFWKQILIPSAAADELENGDVLVWFDADVEFFRGFGPDKIERMLGEHQLCYLGRRGHSEIGFWAVRLCDDVRWFLERIANCYTSGDVFTMPEWHSAYVFDRIRETSHLKERNLCFAGASGHIWPTTAVGTFSQHNKGPRKGGGLQ